MIGLSGESPLALRAASQMDTTELEQLRNKINNKDYLCEAIQRIALILSNELLDISRGGIYHEQRKRRK
jgi:gamma-glutamylcysteine synthetase